MRDRIADLIASWDGEAVVLRRDEPTRSWMFIALHDRTLGMPVGGCRVKEYPEPADGLRDAMRLAEGMTYKWAGVDLPFGGGKAVIALPGPLDPPAREAMLRRFGRLVDSLNGAFATGEDLGTTPEDMRVLAEECRFIMGHGGPDGLGTDPGPYTALGVFTGLCTAVRHGVAGRTGRELTDLEGIDVLVQGTGDVGGPLCRLLAEAGAAVWVSDLDEDRAAVAAASVDGTVVAPEAVYEAACDVYAPCAIGATLNPDTIPRLRCRVVAGSANNQLESPEDADRLHERGILYAPDYIVNAGGAIAFGLMHLGEVDDVVLRTRVLGIGDALNGVFREAADADESPLYAARRKARRALVGPAA